MQRWIVGVALVLALDDAGGATVALLGSLQVGGAVLVPPLYQKRPAVLSP